MTQIATVKRIIGKNRAEIAVPRQSSCGGNCAGCAGCGAASEVVLVEAVNTVHAQPGQKVVVESSTRKVLGIAALVYLLPIALFLAGYLAVSALTESPSAQYAAAGVLFLAGGVLAAAYDKRLRRNGSNLFYITRLF